MINYKTEVKSCEKTPMVCIHKGALIFGGGGRGDWCHWRGEAVRGGRDLEQKPLENIIEKGLKYALF